MSDAEGEFTAAAPWLALLDQAPVRVWLLDSDHRVRWANRAACAVFGRPLSELALRDPVVFGGARAPEDMPARLAALSGRTARWSGWADYPDGTRRYTERTYLPFAGEAPGGPCYFEFTVDQTELMQARERAEAAERRLVEAIRSLPDGLAIEDATGALVLCNEAYARNYGLAPEDMTGLGFAARAAMLGPRLVAIGNAGELPNPASAVERLHQVRRSEEPVQIRAADGREYLVRRAGTSDGGRIVLHSDLTALRDPWDILSDVFEACPTPILVAQAADLQVRMSNAAARALIAAGRPGDVTVWGIEWEDARERDTFVAALRAQGRVEGVEARFRRRDGSRMWLSVWARLATIRGEAVVIATATDVTGDRIARDALHEAWDRVSSVIEACPTPITMARAADGAIVYINDAAKALMRLDADQAQGSTVPHWKSPEDRAAYLAALRRAGRVDGWEHTFHRGDGSPVHLAMWSRLAEFRGEAVIVTTSMDLTEARAREAEREAQKRQLAEAERLAALGEMLSGIAHEINNPLSVLAGQAVLLEETAPDEATRRRALRIAEQAARCARTVQSFLDLARERPGRSEPVALPAVIDEALEVAGPELAAAGVRIDWPRPAAPIHAVGDPERLRQLVVNLIVNAAQAMRDQPGPQWLRLACREDRARRLAVLTVVDSGPGVPEALRERVFQPFFSTKGSGGAGIGLALCRRIAETHGGRIALAPAEGPAGGATFVVDLPLAPAPPPPVADREAPQALRALLAATDAEFRTTAIEVLGLHGIAAEGAADGLAALDRLAAGPLPDAVLIAEGLADLKPADLAATALRRWPELAGRIALLSDDPPPPEAAAPLRHLATPLAPADLAAAVRALSAAGRTRP